MSIIYNGVEIKKLVYNNTEIKDVYYNGIKVYSGTSASFYDKLKAATSTALALEESEWIEFINSGGPAVVRANGETNAFLNKYVKITNTKTSSYVYWQIADFNHDNSGNTVDLVQVNNVISMIFGGSQIYSSSSVRTWLNNTYLSGFSSTIRGIMKTMSVITNNSTTTNDKVKLLSGTEAGYPGSNIMPTGEGNKYPISIRWRDGANNSNYWLRSRNKGLGSSSSNYVLCVYFDGSALNNGYSNTAGVLPVIRF